MKKTNKQIKKEYPAATADKTTPATVKKETQTVSSTEKTCCKCDSSCTCGCQEGKECTCCHGSDSSQTAAKCITMLVSAALISAAILLAGSNCNRARTAVPSSGVTDIKIADYINKNPQVIIASMENYQKIQEKQQQEEEARTQKQNEAQQAANIAETVRSVLADKTNHSLGNENGKFVIIEFFDYRCGWCKRTNTALWDVIDSGKAKNIRWVLMDSPIFGEGSALISRYVLAAGKQGKFKEMHHAVMTSKNTIDEKGLIALAQELNLNIEKLKVDAESSDIKTKLQNNQKLAEKLGINGVPYLIINGKIHPGALLGDALNKAVEESNK